ncbi:MAG: hypothetical protein WBD40_14710 [Tepidisphaeraceae bacterium]
MKTLEERLEDLRHAVPEAPNFVEDVRHALPPCPSPDVRRVRFAMFNWKLASAAGAVAACVLIAVMLWPSSAQRAYAAAAEALTNVRTVHVTGWTLRPEQRYSTALDAPATQPAQRHPIDEWEWTTPDGTSRRFSRQGSITIFDDGERRYEHQADHDRIYVDESAKAPHRMPRFASLLDRLDDLKQRGVDKTDLGERAEGAGHVLRGLRIEKTGERRQDLWFDAKTRLPVHLLAWTWKDGDWSPAREHVIEYDQPVPNAVAQYAPPAGVRREYASGIDARFDAWHDRLKQLAARYKDKPLPQPMELVPRDEDAPIEAYSFGKLPGITSHVVRPLGGAMPRQSLTLGDFLRQSWEPTGTLRVPEALRKLPLNHDLVLAAQTPQRQQVDFVLKSLGLELTEVVEPRTVWVARYDGRPLKDWRDVKAPVPNPQRRALHAGMASGSGPTSIKDLFHGFVFYQDDQLAADRVLIVDETGLAIGADPKPVSGESPYFGGPAAPAIAKQWFAEQFGVTFTEEKREQTVHVVRHRQ